MVELCNVVYKSSTATIVDFTVENYMNDDRILLSDGALSEKILIAIY